MDRFLEFFVNFQRVVKEACQNDGYWYDAADPRTGFAMYGQQASRWNEVQAAHSLLGHPVVEESSVCPIIRHPRFGTPSSSTRSQGLSCDKDVCVHIVPNRTPQSSHVYQEPPHLHDTERINQTWTGSIKS